MSFKQSTINLYDTLETNGDLIKVIEFHCKNIALDGKLTYGDCIDVLIIIYEVLCNKDLLLKNKNDIEELLEYIFIQFCYKQNISIESYPELFAMLKISIRTLLYVPKHLKPNFKNCFYCIK